MKQKGYSIGKYCLGKNYSKKKDLREAREKLTGKNYRFNQVEDIFGGHFLMDLDKEPLMDSDEEPLSIWYNAGRTLYMFHFFTSGEGDVMLKCYDIKDISQIGYIPSFGKTADDDFQST